MFSGSPFLKSGITLAIFIVSGKIPFSSDRLNKCFRGSLLSPKHFLTTLKFLSSYPGLLLVFNEKKASFNLFINIEFFSIILCLWFKKLVNEFEEFVTFLAKLGPTFVKLNSSAISFISVTSFFSITSFISKLDSVLRA